MELCRSKPDQTCMQADTEDVHMVLLQNGGLLFRKMNLGRAHGVEAGSRTVACEPGRVFPDVTSYSVRLTCLARFPIDVDGTTSQRHVDDMPVVKRKDGCDQYGRNLTATVLATNVGVLP